MLVRYRWLDRRHHSLGMQVNHVVDLDASVELCQDIEEEEIEVIQGLQSLGGDFYCVACLRLLVGRRLVVV